MKQRKMAHHVSVKTIPNGYALDVDKTGYMYYTLAELVEGFLLHVGLGVVDYCDKETMHELITACGTFPKEGQAIQAVAGLQAKIEALEQSHKRDLREIETRKQQNLKLSEELTKTKRRLNLYISEDNEAKKAAKAKAEAEVDDDTKPKKDWTKQRLHKDEVVTPKKIIKVKPADKPVNIVPAPKAKVGRPRKYAKDPDLEEKLRKRGVIK